MKQQITLKPHEEKVVPYIWLNGEETHIELHSELATENSSLHIVGIFVGSENKQLVCNTFVSHIAKHTKSRTTIRGVFFNNASFQNDGLIKIVRGAKNADGFFDSKILLFDDAQGRSVPSLEIDENELKAGHASTVGRPDAEQLFYLRSRGIPEAAAERLLVTGFFEPTLALLPPLEQKSIREKLTHIL
jgi:Fe-S cluster assembly protein SufD